MVLPPNALAQTLAARIHNHGPMTVADFMTAALTDPDGGYYMTGDPFGVGGDFITAPEISQTFGELIGLWCAQSWQDMGSPETINLVELGPGRGSLMADALRAASILPGFRTAIRVHLVETSPSLRQRQREALEGVEVTWHEDLGTLPGTALIVIANEFFDALPVRQFERSAAGWLERLVTLSPIATRDAPAFAFTTGDADAASVGTIPQSLQNAPVGTLVETSPAVLGIASDLAARLARQGGVALVIDYGRTAAQAGWSLQAVRNHERHEPLVAPGQADLTAHVDFASLVEAAEAAGARTWGPVTQGRFLCALGIRERANALCATANPVQKQEIETAVARLTDSAQMGKLFKVLAFGHPELPTPAALPTSGADRNCTAS
jgi:NADH dehydrogenase [ubiquinone] 1 alpha subcomplex assembly factor 7